MVALVVEESQLLKTLTSVATFLCSHACGDQKTTRFCFLGARHFFKKTKIGSLTDLKLTK